MRKSEKIWNHAGRKVSDRVTVEAESQVGIELWDRVWSQVMIEIWIELSV
jgi:hypothetical protein